MQENNYYVYILANKRNGTLYIGVTNNLIRRILEHKEKIIKGFTSKYGVDKLVYFEMHKYINNALQRESNIKAWKRKWKLELIESNNKNWNDLFYDLTTEDEIKDLKELIKKRRAWIPAFAGMTIFFVPTVSPEFKSLVARGRCGRNSYQKFFNAVGDATLKHQPRQGKESRDY